MEVPSNVRLYETPISIFWIDEEGMLCGKSKQVGRSIENYYEVINFFKSIVKPGEKLCSLTDANDAVPMSKEIRDFFIAEMPKYIKAQAIITQSPLDTSLNATFMKISFLGFPVRIFTNKEDAKEWLKLYL